MTKAISDELPTDPPRERAGRIGWLPWWLPRWVLVVTLVGVAVIAVAMALVITLPG